MKKVIKYFKQLEEIFKENTSNVSERTLTLETLKAELAEAYQHGLPEADQIGIYGLHEHLRWRKGCVYCYTGYPSSGKSEFLVYLAMLRAKEHGDKIGMYMPESYPVKMLVLKLMKAYLGKNVVKGYTNQCSEAELKQAFKFVQTHFYIIEFDDMPRLSQLLDRYQTLIEDHGCRMFITDPFNAVAEGAAENISSYLKVGLTQMKIFASTRKVINAIVEHPVKPQLDKRGNLPEATPWTLYGGSMWWNKMDTIVVLTRDFENNSSVVKVKVWKNKIHEIDGKPGEKYVVFNIATGQYEPLNEKSMDQETRERLFF